MTAAASPRPHPAFSDLPISTRGLYSSVLLVLGLAYLFGGIYLYHSYAGRAGGHPLVLTYQDIVVGYAGSGSTSRLESALNGPMRAMLLPEEIGPILSWIHAGADRAAYEAEVRPTFERRCLSCHDGSNPHLANFEQWPTLKKVTELDTGAGVFTLVRVSHIHLFGLTMVFFVVGMIFRHARLRDERLKFAVTVAPFAGLVVDIGAWYLTKLYQPFAWVVIGGGLLMGFAFAFMLLVSMQQMWLPAWRGRPRKWRPAVA
jgi:hypothetical protein